MGLSKLLERMRDATLAVAFEGLFPRDDPANTRFSINFFTSIGKQNLDNRRKGGFSIKGRISFQVLVA